MKCSSTCLQELREWSDDHPKHLPVFVLVQPNGSPVLPGPPNPVPITPQVLDTLDAEIRSVMRPRDLVTPDQVRGKHATLEAAALVDRWPRLDDSRGKFVFLLDQHRDEYVVGHEKLAGRVMFPASQPGQPDAAFVQIPDARGNEATISDLVRKGYLVRTRADEPVVTPTTGDVTCRRRGVRERRDRSSARTTPRRGSRAAGVPTTWHYFPVVPSRCAIRRGRRSADHAISSSRGRDHRADRGRRAA